MQPLPRFFCGKVYPFAVKSAYLKTKTQIEYLHKKIIVNNRKEHKNEHFDTGY